MNVTPDALPGRGLTLFLCYRRALATPWFMHSVARALEDAGARVLYDSGLEIGDIWDAEVRGWIGRADAVVALVHPGWSLDPLNADDPVLDELSYAASQSTPVVPILCGGLEEPPWRRGKQPLPDFLDGWDQIHDEPVFEHPRRLAVDARKVVEACRKQIARAGRVVSTRSNVRLAVGRPQAPPLLAAVEDGHLVLGDRVVRGIVLPAGQNHSVVAADDGRTVFIASSGKLWGLDVRHGRPWRAPLDIPLNARVLGAHRFRNTGQLVFEACLADDESWWLARIDTARVGRPVRRFRADDLARDATFVGDGWLVTFEGGALHADASCGEYLTRVFSGVVSVDACPIAGDPASGHLLAAVGVSARGPEAQVVRVLGEMTHPLWRRSLPVLPHRIQVIEGGEGHLVVVHEEAQVRLWTLHIDPEA